MTKINDSNASKEIVDTSLNEFVFTKEKLEKAIKEEKAMYPSIVKMFQSILDKINAEGGIAYNYLTHKVVKE